MILLYSLIGLLILLFLWILFRTWAFKPHPLEEIKTDKPKIDEARAISSLQAMLRIKTVSYEDKKKEDKAAFDAFKELLITRYPNINQKATFQDVGETGLLFIIKGEKPQEPIVLMSHYDVVPENGIWQKDPFCGDIVNDRIYGRGAIDTKSTLASIMEATNKRLSDNKPLKRDLYLAFSGDEETRGPSAPAIVQYLKDHGVRPWLVLDEGGAIVEQPFPGVSTSAAFIGLAEKGYANINIKARVQGGHASMPPKQMAITKLAKAIRILDKDALFKKRLTKPTRLMFDNLARHSKSLKIKIAFANLWCFMPFAKLNAKKSPLLASLLKTTQSFTTMNGSDAMNVLPSSASIGINYRIISGESKESVLKKVQSKVKKLGLEVKMEKGADPTPTSKMDAAYTLLQKTIQNIYGGVIITPYLMMAGTDARYHHDISDYVYRFSPMVFSKEDRRMVHSTDEAVKISTYLDCVAFYHRLLGNIT